MSPAQALTPSSNAPPAPCVYIVDDDEGIGAAVCRLLDSVGIASCSFNSPEAAIASLTPEASGCLVMDVRMPVMGGVDAYLALKARGVTLPVVFVTAHHDVATAVRAMKAGATDLLLKPLNHQALIDAVNTAMASDRQRRSDGQEQALLRVRYEQLTPREREVMDLVVAGRLNKQIAGALGTTEKTVKVHRGQVMRKMGVDSVADLVRAAARLNLPA